MSKAARRPAIWRAPRACFKQKRTHHGVSFFFSIGFLSSAAGYWYSSPHPFWMRRGAQGQAVRDRDCLSRRRVRASPRLLAKQKKSELPPGNPRPAELSSERACRSEISRYPLNSTQKTLPRPLLEASLTGCPSASLRRETMANPNPKPSSVPCRGIR
jgi:hypothetical protein